MNGVMINAIPVLTRGDDAHQTDVAEHVLGAEGGRAAHGGGLRHCPDLRPIGLAGKVQPIQIVDRRSRPNVAGCCRGRGNR